MRRLWALLNTRRGRTIAIVVGGLVVVYSLIGFIGVPQALHYGAHKLAQKTGTTVRLDSASFNPYTFRLSLVGFRSATLKSRRTLASAT